MQDSNAVGPVVARFAGGRDDDRVVAISRACCSAEWLWRALVQDPGSWWLEMQFDGDWG